ncbi:MAG: YozQ family protein [Heyndrickxia sp.]
MSELKNNNQSHEGTIIAEKSYTPNDYKSNSEPSKGLAMTHEQVGVFMLKV